MSGELLPGLRAVREFGESRAAFWADPPRGACTREACAETDAILYGEPAVCASCYRATQARRGLPYPCDVCGRGPALRDPLDRQDVLLCEEHQASLRGYVPTERAMVSIIEERVGFTHSQGRKEVCVLAGLGTDCAGGIKPRGKKGIMCDKHNDPRKWMRGVQ